jgi:hypothetical protein
MSANPREPSPAKRYAKATDSGVSTLSKSDVCDWSLMLSGGLPPKGSPATRRQRR